MVTHMCLLSYWIGYGITYVSLIILEWVWYHIRVSYHTGMGIVSHICVSFHTGLGMVSHMCLFSYWNGYGITYVSLIILEWV